jgi:hypothetical protein
MSCQCLGSLPSSISHQTFNTMGFPSYLMEDTGHVVDQDAPIQSRIRRSDLLREGRWVDQTLGDNGVSPPRGPSVHAVGFCSGRSEELPQFTPTMLNPYLANRDRNELLRNLKYFLSNSSATMLAMCTFTLCQRTHLYGVGAGISSMQRNLSTLNCELRNSGFDVEILLRSTELGSETCEVEGPSFHLHIHAILKFQRLLEVTCRTPLLH